VRVLVTGGTGYVGTAVVGRLIAAGHDVSVLTRTSIPAAAEAGCRQGDLLVPSDLYQAVGGVDAVCHLAAFTRVRGSFTAPLDCFQTNVTGTLNLLDAMQRESERTDRPLRLVFASTGAVYGVPAHQPIPESQYPSPTSPYGASKLAAEIAIAHQVRTGVVGSVVLRAFNVAGAVGAHRDPDESRIIPKALAVAAGRARHVHVNGDGSAEREFVHVDDLARAYVAALEACRPGDHKVFNVGSGTGVSVKDIITTVEQVTGKQVTVTWGPPLPEPAVLLADSSLIRDELSWSPQRSDLTSIVSDAWSALNTAL